MANNSSQQQPTALNFAHAMLREIYEQPQAIRETIRGNVEGDVIFPSALRPLETLCDNGIFPP